MSKITNAIPQQQFEFIRTRILEILVDEFEGQYILTDDNDLNIKVYLERSTPVDTTEMSAIVVSFAQGSWGNKNQGNVDGTYIYHIDIYTSAANKSWVSGDTAAAIKLEKLLGVARAILEDPIYKTLGVVPPFIMKSYFSEVNIQTPTKIGATDLWNSSMGRLTFNVVANESSKLTIPQLIESYTTQIKIDNSGQGYFYKGETYL